jgi:hypothetical protein
MRFSRVLSTDSARRGPFIFPHTKQNKKKNKKNKKKTKTTKKNERKQAKASTFGPAKAPFDIAPGSY